MLLPCRPRGMMGPENPGAGAGPSQPSVSMFNGGPAPKKDLEFQKQMRSLMQAINDYRDDVDGDYNQAHTPDAF